MIEDLALFSWSLYKKLSPNGTFSLAVFICYLLVVFLSLVYAQNLFASGLRYEEIQLSKNFKDAKSLKEKQKNFDQLKKYFALEELNDFRKGFLLKHASEVKVDLAHWTDKKSLFSGSNCQEQKEFFYHSGWFINSDDQDSDPSKLAINGFNLTKKELAKLCLNLKKTYHFHYKRENMNSPIQISSPMEFKENLLSQAQKEQSLIGGSQAAVNKETSSGFWNKNGKYILTGLVILVGAHEFNKHYEVKWGF